MAVLLVVHHTASPAMQELLDAVLAGARADGIEGVEVRTRAALVASPVDVLQADGFLLGTPVNIGYLSGAMKHFFDKKYTSTDVVGGAASRFPAMVGRLLPCPTHRPLRNRISTTCG